MVPPGETWYWVTALPTWNVFVPASDMDMEICEPVLSDCMRSATRPPQPLRTGWSGREVCQWTVWSLCEKSWGGRAAVLRVVLALGHRRDQRPDVGDEP